MSHNNNDNNHNHNRRNYVQVAGNKNNNKNNKNNLFNPNKNGRIIHKREYLKNKGVIEHNKIQKIISTSFSKRVQSLLNFDDILSLRIIKDRIGFSVYFFRYFTDGFDYFDDVDEGLNRLISILPVFEKLSVFITNQMIWGKHKKYVKMDFTWTNSVDDIKESGIDSLESLLMALKTLEFDIDTAEIFDTVKFERILGRGWKMRRIKRSWHGTNTYKYILNNAYLSPKFIDSRDGKDDVTAIKVANALKQQYPMIKVHVVRLGSLNLKYLPTRLVITSSVKLKESDMISKYRRICGQRVMWEKFEDNKSKKEFHILSDKEKLDKFKELPIDVGKHQVRKYDEDKNDDENNVDDDYNYLSAFWRSTVNTTSLSSKVYENVLKIYDGNDGAEWSKIVKDQKDAFIEYASQVRKEQSDIILNQLDNFVPAGKFFEDKQYNDMEEDENDDEDISSKFNFKKNGRKRPLENDPLDHNKEKRVRISNNKSIIC